MKSNLPKGSTMIAIAIVPENFNEILQSAHDENLWRSDLELLVEDEEYNSKSHYFVPDWHPTRSDAAGWMILSDFSLETVFDYELPRTSDRWFEITRK
jgi:hypothetical protein